MRARISGVKCKAGGGSGDRSALLRVDGLVAIAVARRIFARDVGRQRDVADAFRARRRKSSTGAKRMRRSPNSPRARLRPEFVVSPGLLTEEEMFARRRSCGRDEPDIPIRWGRSCKLAGEQDLDASAEEVARGGIVRADGLGSEALAAAVEARGKDAGVVEDDEIAGAQQVGEIAEAAVFEGSGGGGRCEHARGGAVGEGFLRNQFFGGRS